MKASQIVAGVATAALLATALPRVASAEMSGPAVASSLQSNFAAQRERLLPFAGWAAPTQQVSIMVHLPLRNQAEAESLVAQMATPGSQAYHHWLSRDQFMSRYAPLGSDMRNAAASLRAGGFRITNVDSQFVYASAPSATVERFFNTRMGLVHDGTALRLDARTPISLPASLIKIGATIIGLRALPHPVPAHVSRRNVLVRPLSKTNPLQINPGGFFPGELMQAYGNPSYTVGNGKGMSIAIVGLSDSTDSDNQGLWCSEGLGPTCAVAGGTLAPYPTVNHFEAPGSIPPDTDGNSVEATLDAQMAGGTAPGAIIDQYADSQTDGGNVFLGAYMHIVDTSHEDIITTSYIFCEGEFIGQFSYLQANHDVYLQGNLQGQTFLVASGDNGAYGCAYLGDTTTPYANGLASDPDATGVGGSTEFDVTSPDGILSTQYEDESSHSDPPNEWASGGGVSIFWRAPRFQTLIGISPIRGRQLPDVSMHMGGIESPFTFDIIEYEGGLGGVVGTSCASPEFAGTLASSATAVNASRGVSGGFRFGNVNNFLYYEQAAGNAANVYHQNIPGDNLLTTYNPGSGLGYNQVIGLGTVNIPGFDKALGYAGTYQPAGNLVTASNP